MTTSDASDQPIVLPPAWKDTLSHMLGAKSDTPGFRNFFCAIVGRDEDQPMLDQMADAGLIFAGKFINEGKDRLYHATEAGYAAIGLKKDIANER